LDKYGFRYYLPAGMMRCLGAGIDQGLCFHLTLPEEFGTAEFGVDLRAHHLNKWSALSGNQRHSVAHFIRYMADTSRLADPMSAPGWKRALASYWDQYL
jgi:hypothetical protein